MPAIAAPVPAVPKEPTAPVTAATKAEPASALVAAPSATDAFLSDTCSIRAAIDVRSEDVDFRSVSDLTSVSAVKGMDFVEHALSHVGRIGGRKDSVNCKDFVKA